MNAVRGSVSEGRCLDTSDMGPDRDETPADPGRLSARLPRARVETTEHDPGARQPSLERQGRLVSVAARRHRRRCGGQRPGDCRPGSFGRSGPRRSGGDHSERRGSSGRRLLHDRVARDQRVRVRQPGHARSRDRGDRGVGLHAQHTGPAAAFDADQDDRPRRHRHSQPLLHDDRERRRRHGPRTRLRGHVLQHLRLGDRRVWVRPPAHPAAGG